MSMRKHPLLRRLGLLGTGTLLGVSLAFGVQAGPGEYRTRLPSKSVTSSSVEADVQAEIAFGRDVAARILGRHGLVSNKQFSRYINLVGNGIALSGPRPELNYRFAVLDTDEINAYASPGGYIFVTRGAINLMQDEAELAAVLSHEIAHVTQKHIVKELNIHGSDSTPEAGLAHFLGGAGDPSRVAFSQAVDKAVEILFEKGLKREDEFEADQVGTLLLAQTGYDPTALERYLERVKAVTDEERVHVLHSTHPPFDQRLEHLAELIQAQSLAELRYPTVAERFRENKIQ